MTVTTLMLILLVGVAIGTISGMVGIGGGVLVIPLLMFIFGFTQAKANGTSLAMLLPPIGIFAVLTYARAGNVNWPFAGLLALGFAAGALVGARLVNSGMINPTVLRVGFALLLVYCAGRMLFQNGGRARSAVETTLLVAAFGLTYLAMRLLGRHWSRASGPWATEYRARLKRQEPPTYDYEI